MSTCSILLADTHEELDELRWTCWEVWMGDAIAAARGNGTLLDVTDGEKYVWDDLTTAERRDTTRFPLFNTTCGESNILNKSSGYTTEPAAIAEVLNPAHEWYGKFYIILPTVINETWAAAVALYDAVAESFPGVSRYEYIVASALRGGTE